MSRHPLAATLVRLTITSLLLAWVLSRPDVRDGLLTAEFQRPWWLLGAFLCGGGAALLSAWRWHACLRVCDCALPFTTVLRISLAGNAAGLLSVGALGEDAVRVTLGTRQLPERKGAFLASIALDHMSAAPVMILLVSLIIGTIGLSAKMTQATATTIGVSFAIFMSIGLSIRYFRRDLHDVLLGYVRKCIFAPGTATAMLISLPLLVLHHGIFWCAASALPINANPFGIFSAFVVADSVAALPISVAGLGVREKSIEFLLHKWYGVAPSLAVKASLTGLAILALWAIIGVASLPFRSDKKTPAP